MQEAFILRDHKNQNRLEKIFTYFAVEHNDKNLMDLCEFVFFLDTAGLISSENDKCNDVDILGLCISNMNYMGVRSYDLMSFKLFFKTLLVIAEFKTFDNVSDKKTRFVSFFKALFAQIAEKTKIR